MGTTTLGRWLDEDQGSPELDVVGGERQDTVQVVTRKGLLGDGSSATLSVVGPRVFSGGSWVPPG